MSCYKCWNKRLSVVNQKILSHLDEKKLTVAWLQLKIYEWLWLVIVGFVQKILLYGCFAPAGFALVVHLFWTISSKGRWKEEPSTIFSTSVIRFLINCHVWRMGKGFFKCNNESLQLQVLCYHWQCSIEVIVRDNIRKGSLFLRHRCRCVITITPFLISFVLLRYQVPFPFFLQPLYFSNLLGATRAHISHSEYRYLKLFRHDGC